VGKSARERGERERERKNKYSVDGEMQQKLINPLVIAKTF
jgi:hypothetical protein